LTKILAILMGIAFLNMGFFLSEVRMLDLDHSPMVENIAKLVSTIGCEEEKDGMESPANDSSSPSFDFCVTSHSHGSSPGFLIADGIHDSRQFTRFDAITGEIPTPPPWIA
jgi:hypothetical protein